MEALASDEMRGRGSATKDELAAAKYIASQSKLLKIDAAGDDGGYLHTAKFMRRSRGSPDAAPTEATTTNVVGILRGSDSKLTKDTVLLSAHLDHLGIGREVNGDKIYNGADDDASGVTAVLELAAALAAGPKPKRTVVFALFGSEEIGGVGARYFQEHPPVPIESFVANLEFEMIGRPDAAVAAHTLWLTGYERSNLGAELAAHGARLVADPHPDQHFFQRSDNYVLAKKGIIAHTVSSYGLHSDYHRPSDDLAHIDFGHMTEAIASMVEPVRWLVNTSFRPEWSKDGRP
jgi:Zn-dependent M28 family amino/carboxypeptidase